ncbi:hypothetical protein [Caulobacter mirabilis]|nr:hypothetical protein [Caulobacter mirabilis]
MNVDSPQFFALFGAAWLILAAYNVWLVRIVQHRRAMAGETKLPFLQAMFGPERGRGIFSELKFLFTGEHRRLGDEALTRLVMTTRALFAVGGVLLLSVFVVAFTGDAPDVR